MRTSGTRSRRQRTRGNQAKC